MISTPPVCPSWVKFVLFLTEMKGNFIANNKVQNDQPQVAWRGEHMYAATKSKESRTRTRATVLSYIYRKSTNHTGHSSHGLSSLGVTWSTRGQIFRKLQNQSRQRSSSLGGIPNLQGLRGSYRKLVWSV